MLSFELSAIDLILAISVVVLLILYMTKMSIKLPEKTSFLQSLTKVQEKKKVTSTIQNGYAECPRGFGNIKKIGTNNSVSERCLGCYKIMECYDENE